MHFLPANRLRIYRNFKAIEATDFYEIVRFYERHEPEIHALEEDRFLECTLAYTNALFETGQYAKHLVMCDFLLEQIIRLNYDTWDGVDLFTKILFDKGVSLIYRHEYSQAAHVCRELLKIEPKNQHCARLLKKALLRQKPYWLRRARAFSVLLILLSAFTAGVHVLVLMPFFPEFIKLGQYSQYALLGAGLALLFLGEAAHYFSCQFQVYHFKKQISERKR